MQDQDLIRMANQIAAFFEPYPHDEAVAGIADHMRSFWEPRMRIQMCSILDNDGGKGLTPLALEGAQEMNKASRAAADEAAPTDNKFGGGKESHGV